MPEWAVAVIVIAVLLIAAGVVVVAVRARKRRYHPDTDVPIVPSAPVLDQTDSVPGPAQTPLECQPVAPADQAQGFGWMKASDLANQRKKP